MTSVLEAPDPRLPASSARAVPEQRSSGQTAGAAAAPGRRTSLGRLLMVSDGLAAVAALLVHPSCSPLALLVTVATAFTLADSDLYRRRLRLSVVDDAAALWLRGLAASTACGGALLLLGDTPTGAALLANGFAFVLLALLGRACIYRLVTRQRLAGVRHDRAVVLGAGPRARELAHALRTTPSSGVVPVAFLRAGPGRPLDGLPVLALDTAAAFVELVEQLGVDVVLVAADELRGDQVVPALRACDRLGCDVFVLPELDELGTWQGHSEEVRGLPLVRLRRSAHRSLAWRVKRPLDLLLAGSALLLAAPVIALCAAAARLDGGPGVLFRQVRVGLDGVPFTLYKIRSLRPAGEGESSTRWNVAQDPRLTRFGRFLRSTSFDELPQLWNVVRGDMSLVGPRPERPHYVAKFSQELPHYHARTRVPVGLTGWAQVNGLRGDTSISDRARYDNQYIENWSLALDVKIMCWTIAQVLRRAGA